MTEYQRIKAELKKQCRNIKYFSAAFLATFKNARAKARFNIEHDIDDSYRENDITLYHGYDEIYTSDFYQKNGSGYCSFLEIAYWLGI